MNFSINEHPTSVRTFAAMALGLAGLVLASPASAQETKSQGWFKTCAKQGENDICNVQYNVLSSTGQTVSAVNLLTIKGKINRQVFQVAVPSGRFIPAGIKVQIDNGKNNTLPYTICVPDRCLAETKLTDQLVKILKGGGNIKLTSTNFRNQPNPIDVTLKGFTAAYDGPPLKRTELETQQQKLKEELEKKAEETRKKLQDAQEKAKSGG